MNSILSPLRRDEKSTSPNRRQIAKHSFFGKLGERNTFQIRITTDRAQVIQKGAQKSKAHFFGLIIRFAFGIRAFFCCLGYYPSQKVESLWFKLYLVARLLMVS